MDTCIAECTNSRRPGGPTMYAGFEWFACSCGNTYGSAGGAPPGECSPGRQCHPTLASTATGCHSLGIYILILLSLLFFLSNWQCWPGLGECGVGDNLDDPTAPTCGMVPMEMEDVMSGMQNGVSEFPACVGKNAVYQIGRKIGNRIVSQTPSYVGCYRMGMFRPPGVTLYGNAFFDDSTRASGSGGGMSSPARHCHFDRK